MLSCNAGERLAATLNINRPGFNTIRVIDFLPSNATSWTVAGPQLPPWIEGGQIFTSVAQKRVEWSFVAEGTNASDAVVMQLGYNFRMGTEILFANWTFLLPPNTTSVKLPELPSSFDDIMPGAEFNMFVNRINTFDNPTVNGYDMLRGMGTANAFCPECAVRAGELQRVIISGF
jgi:hypothetical protein